MGRPSGAYRPRLCENAKRIFRSCATFDYEGEKGKAPHVRACKSGVISSPFSSAGVFTQPRPGAVVHWVKMPAQKRSFRDAELRMVANPGSIHDYAVQWLEMADDGGDEKASGSKPAAHANNWMREAQ